MSPEVEDCREGPHPLIECLETKCFLQGAIRLGATILTATFYFRPANTHVLSYAPAVLIAGIE